MPTSRLEAAIASYVQQCPAQKRVYARETPGGGRVFDVIDDEAAWKETDTACCPHLYEILTGPCNTYLDVEWKVDAQDLEKEQFTVNRIADMVKEALCADYGEQECQVDMVTASGVVRGKWKASWHVHVQCSNMCWEDARALGQWVRERFADVPEIDKIPYNAPMQNWRCVGSSKASDPKRVFRPKSKSMFMTCLVGCKADGRSVVVNKAPLKRARECAPDWTLQLACLLGQMRSESSMLMSDRYLIVPFRNRVHCHIANRVHSSNHQYAVVDVLGIRWRMKCHNGACAEQCDHWRPMPNFEKAKAIWKKHVQPRATVTHRPPVRVPNVPTNSLVRYRMRGDVPPAFVERDCALWCKSGIYVERKEQAQKNPDTV